MGSEFSAGVPTASGNANITAPRPAATRMCSSIQLRQRATTLRDQRLVGAASGSTATVATGSAQNADAMVAVFGPYSAPGVVNPCTSGSTDTAKVNAPTRPSSAVPSASATRIMTSAAATHAAAAATTTANNSHGAVHTGRSSASSATDCTPTTSVHSPNHVRTHTRFHLGIRAECWFIAASIGRRCHRLKF